MNQESDLWKQCSSCKKPISFSTSYWVCSVSTCNRKRFPLFFCSVPCWDAHVPGERHREAWAIDKRSPSREEHALATAVTAPAGRHVESEAAQAVVVPAEILVVASRYTDYLSDRMGATQRLDNRFLHQLSEALRECCDKAIERARADGRKTVMDRDFPSPRLAPGVLRV